MTAPEVEETTPVRPPWATCATCGEPLRVIGVEPALSLVRTRCPGCDVERVVSVGGHGDPPTDRDDEDGDG